MSIRKPIIGRIRHQNSTFWRLAVFFLPLLAASPLCADESKEEEEIQALQHQNALLEQQVEKQNQSIQTLTEKVQQLEAPGAAQPNASGENNPPPAASGFNLGNVNLSAEGGIAFFNTGHEGFAPDSDFRVDEARLYIEAPIWKEVYFSGEVDLATRENTSLSVQMGELYLDCEDLSDLWGRDGQLNLRVGHLNIPFGEEYLSRYAIDNPLISHSVSDLWGFDNGVELYGTLSKFNYVVAVQNGSGKNGVQDFNGDKSVAGRIGYDPNKHWHFSVSAMRTGNVSTAGDFMSAIWFGNGFFQSVGGPGTSMFDVNLVEGNVAARWASGHISAFGGYGRYHDNNPAANDGRDIFYYAVEGVQDLPAKFYAAMRFSQVLSDKGVPVLGFGAPGTYFSAVTTELWRLSFGLGYRFSDNFIVKTEYALEGGRDLDGDARNFEDFFGTEAAFKF